MPDINQSLQGKDLQFLQQIADIWGVELHAQDLRSTIQQLGLQMAQRELFQDLIEVFSDESKRAIREIVQAEGKIPWTLFTRKYGDLRVMGAARRERERPDLNPQNATEVLWYSGILSKAFFNLQKEPQEYAYIPDEFVQFLSHDSEPTSDEPHLPGRPATSSEKARLVPASDAILDHLTTLLSAIRTGAVLDEIPWLNTNIPIPFLIQLARSAQLLNEQNKIQPSNVRQFMESNRAEALLMLVNGWLNPTFNDLFLLPGFVFEGSWHNPIAETKQYLLSELTAIDEQTWWSLTSFVSYIRQVNPDYQRPAGDYDSWYIRRENSEDYVRGLANWDVIDGELIRIIISKHMHWLGLMDLATVEKSTNISAFRFSKWAVDLLTNHTPEGLVSEKTNFKILSDGTIKVPRNTSRAVRYQVARFCHLVQEKENEYQYQIEPISLNNATKAGLKIEQFINLLNKNAQKPIPPSIFTLLENWKTNGVQVNFAPVTLLTCKDPAIIDQLQNSRAKKYLGERLNSNTILINEKQIKLVMSILAELGYLSDIHSTSIVKIR
jgi:hypothetical protein